MSLEKYRLHSRVTISHLSMKYDGAEHLVWKGMSDGIADLALQNGVRTVSVGEHSTTFQLDCYVLPPDQVFGLITKAATHEVQSANRKLTSQYYALRKAVRDIAAQGPTYLTGEDPLVDAQKFINYVLGALDRPEIVEVVRE